jgi:hypothetical protein
MLFEFLLLSTRKQMYHSMEEEANMSLYSFLLSSGIAMGGPHLINLIIAFYEESNATCYVGRGPPFGIMIVGSY